MGMQLGGHIPDEHEDSGYRPMAEINRITSYNVCYTKLLRANVINPSLDQEAFWGPLMDVVEWAEHGVASILCSCLATHALIQHHHGIRRRHLPAKRWGVYGHRVVFPEHSYNFV